MEIIKHKLDLVLKLIDATTGRPVPENNIRFYKDGEEFHMADKGGSTFFAVNAGRYNFNLSIEIYGYERKGIYVDYEKLDEKLPLIYIYFLPIRALSLEGDLQGITEIQAVREGAQGTCFTSTYDERKKILGLFNPHGTALDKRHYGIINQDKGTYEPILIDDEDTKIKAKLSEPLKGAFKVNDPLERIVFGEIREGGHYVLKVADDANSPNYIVRFVVDGEEYFNRVNFRQLEGVTLTPVKPPVAEDVAGEEDVETEVNE